MNAALLLFLPLVFHSCSLSTLHYIHCIHCDARSLMVTSICMAHSKANTLYLKLYDFVCNFLFK